MKSAASRSPLLLNSPLHHLLDDRHDRHLLGGQALVGLGHQEHQSIVPRVCINPIELLDDAAALGLQLPTPASGRSGQQAAQVSGGQVVRARRRRAPEAPSHLALNPTAVEV